MKKNRTKGLNAGDFFPITGKERSLIYVFFGILLLIWAVPIYSMIKNSLKVNGLANYTYVMTHEVNGVPFWRYFINSAINAIGSSLLVVGVCILSGYAFSKLEFVGKKIIFNFSIICLAISGPVLIIPFFSILKSLHLYNTHLGIVLCETTITVPFGLLMMKNYFDQLPNELMEAGRVDGASSMQVFRHIYAPLSFPALINLGVLQFMWSLQDFMFPLMFLTKEKLYTTTVAVNSFQGAYGMSPQNLGRYNASLVLISIPSIIVFIFGQKYIINGVTAGAVKG